MTYVRSIPKKTDARAIVQLSIRSDASRGRDKIAALPTSGENLHKNIGGSRAHAELSTGREWGWGRGGAANLKNLKCPQIYFKIIKLNLNIFL